MSSQHKNHLSSETSPYLLQHADNPVDWYPWGEEALLKASDENRPILLSIGYSACHWCHVMAHESFEDEDTAAIMNRLFVNIKVDREERPDLDKIYQTAHYMLTQRSGGWPLTMFLMPGDQIPFFGGTYFPSGPRHGLPAFSDLLQQISDFFHDRQEDILRQSASLTHYLESVYTPLSSVDTLNAIPLDNVRIQLKQQYDAKHGGFGAAPKFPHTPSIERLFRHWAATRKEESEDIEALEMAEFTLEKMALGGVYDQLGGGFCRYSVDDYWMIPHFEKMLYDNGVLLAEYAQAYVVNKNPLFAKIATETAQWVIREMQSPEGGYYSSLDADSEGEEGLFYVWTPKDVKALLDEQEYALFAARFGLDRAANFEGKWHLHVFRSHAELAKLSGKSENTIETMLSAACKKLRKVRDKRIWPGRDEKILVSWNALMIRGMAMTARYLDRPEFADSAEKALDFIQTSLWKDGRLLATCKDGKAHLMAYLDDYAYLLDAVLTLLQTRWRSSDLHFAVQLAEVLLQHFEDKDAGGFWFVADDHENLIQRPKTYTDEAIPSGNGVAAFALARLGYLLAETRYLDAAERTLKNGAAGMSESPYSHCSLLKSLEEYLFVPQTIIIRGTEREGREWQEALNQDYAPRQQVFMIPADEEDLPAALESKQAMDMTVAYICEGMACLQPCTDLGHTDLFKFSDRRK
jgi:uncharacterized protein YyaL (SSP411 family)